MRSEGFLKAERALAQHCAAVTRHTPGADELAVALAVVAPRLEQALAEQLAALLGGDRPQVTCGKVERVAAPRLHKMIDAVAVNWLFADPAGGEVMVSLGLAGALALTDLVFGGPGLPPAVLPERLPKSTDLALVRAADSIGAALGKALERAGPLAMMLRSDVLGKLIRARDDDLYLTLRVQLSQDGGVPIELQVVLRLAQALALLGTERALPAARLAQQPDAAAEPFASIPLPLVAVLAELKLPVARVSALKPGDILVLSVPRELSLRLAGKPIARGQAGMADGMLALRLTHTGWTNPANHKDMTHG